MCEPYHFKMPEDIAHLLAEACVITVCDCRKGFWHQQLDEANSFLTAFNTELGRFCYTVMPFGTTVAGDVFQCKLDECFGKIKQVIIIADDIMIFGYKPDHSDQDQASTNLLQTAQKCNVKLNYDKLQYKQDEVEFFGETYTTSGYKPSKVSAITAMPSSTNKKQVQSFTGMINCLFTFSLRFQSLLNQSGNSLRIKDHLIGDLSINKPSHRWRMKFHMHQCLQITTTLQTDASVKGLGACLLQDDRAVYFASKALIWCQ